MIWFNRPRALPTTLTERAQSLSNELQKSERHYRRMARVDYYFSLFLVWIAIAASVTITIAGVLSALPAKWLGIIALVPTIAILINTALQPWPRANWHYKKSDALAALRQRLHYELPLEMTADNIAAISADLQKLNKEMDEQWNKSIAVDWGAITHFKAPAAPHQGNPPP